MQVFMSYAHADKILAIELARALEESGLRVWIDRRMLAGVEWRAELAEKIRSHEAMVFLLTPASAASAECRWEYEEAVAAGKSIVPVRAVEMEPPAFLSHLQVGDLTSGVSRKGVGQLLSALYEAVGLSTREAKDRAKQQRALRAYIKQVIEGYQTRLKKSYDRGLEQVIEPYKFLYAFELKDHGIFFGRNEAVADFQRAVLKDRLTVLHAKSGAGKTSLMRAGLGPCLLQQGLIPIYARVYEDPLLSIKRSIMPLSQGSWPKELFNLSLQAYLGQVCEHLGEQTSELVIFLDQFEQFFIRFPGPARQPFISQLADAYNDPALPVRFVIALRKEYYSDLADFKEHISTIFYNEYRLEQMSRVDAKEAITEPLKKLGRRVEYEHVMLDRLLNDLERGGMELPYLQIICSELHEALSQDETTIGMKHYRELGGAEGVLGRYLKRVLGNIPSRGVEIAKQILKELVSSEATKRVLNYEALEARVEADTVELKDMLARLVDDRLLQRSEVEGENRYELAHEYLTDEITGWMNERDFAFKQVEEMLGREIATWRVHRKVIPQARLELIFPHRQRLGHFDDETLECILISSLGAGIPIDEWTEIREDEKERFLLAALGEEKSQIRRMATLSLGEIWEFEEVRKLGDEDEDVRYKAASALRHHHTRKAMLPLIAALKDDSPMVREAAAGALEWSRDPQAVGPLVSILNDEERGVRIAAIGALSRLGDPRAVLPLKAALNDEHYFVRQAATMALGTLRDPRAVQDLIATLDDEQPSLRQMAAWALGELGDPSAMQALLSALNDVHYSVRQTAARSLVKLGGSETVEPLMAALNDEDRGVCREVAMALGKLGDPRAYEPLVAALNDKKYGAREAAAGALGDLGNPQAIWPLIDALSDKIVEIRQEAAKALGKLGKADASGALIATLRDKDDRVRKEAAKALGKLGDPRAVEPLRKALSDESVSVQKAAAWALGKLGIPVSEFPKTR